MFKVKFFGVFGVLFLFLGCKKTSPEYDKAIEAIQYIENQKSKRLDSIFKSIDKVELISFPNKVFWEKDFSMTSNDKIHYEIPKDKIIDNIILKKNDLQEILNILKADYKDKCSEAACYEPRHILRFYKRNKVIAFYEICLECGQNRNSKNLDDLPMFCVEKGSALKEKFMKLELKNYGDDSPILKKYNYEIHAQKTK